MTLDASQYADPLLVLERKQEAELRKVAQCGDCINARMIFRGQPFCTMKYQRFGYRCDKYERADK